MGKATFYVQFERKRKFWAKGPDRDGKEIVGGGHHEWELRPVAMTTKAPSVRRGTVLTKLTVEIPDQAFEPLVPEATIVFGLEEVKSMTVSPEPIEDDEVPSEPPVDA